VIELYFLLYRIPQMMTRLARERNRSALTWSLIGIAAWVGAEFAVALGIGLIYGLTAFFMGWPDEVPVGLRLLTYILALVAAILSVTLVKRILSSKDTNQTLPLPPAPPSFQDYPQDQR
jgi:uncharacterized membrane protein